MAIQPTRVVSPKMAGSNEAHSFTVPSKHFVSQKGFDKKIRRLLSGHFVFCRFLRSSRQLKFPPVPPPNDRMLFVVCGSLVGAQNARRVARMGDPGSGDIRRADPLPRPTANASRHGEFHLPGLRGGRD